MTYFNCNLFILLKIHDPLALLKIVSTTILLQNLNDLFWHEKVLGDSKSVNRLNLESYELGLGVSQNDLFV